MPGIQALLKDSSFQAFLPIYAINWRGQDSFSYSFTGFIIARINYQVQLQSV
jgi:hypothetical protein